MNGSVCTPSKKLTTDDRHVLFEQNYADVSQKIERWAKQYDKAEIEILLMLELEGKCSNLFLNAARHEIDYWKSRPAINLPANCCECANHDRCKPLDRIGNAYGGLECAQLLYAERPTP